MSTAAQFIAWFAIGFTAWTALMGVLHVVFTRSSKAIAAKEQLQRRRIRRHVFRLP